MANGRGTISIIYYHFLLKKLDFWHYWYYNIDMKKRVSKRVPNMSIRIDRDVVYLAKIEAVKSKMTLGEWLEAAIKEKIKRDLKNT